MGDLVCRHFVSAVLTPCPAACDPQLRQAVQANPAVLPGLIEQIGRASPEALRTIAANREAFLQLMNEPVTEAELAGDGDEGGDEQLPPQYVLRAQRWVAYTRYTGSW